MMFKDFFKPTTGKIILFIAFVLITGYSQHYLNNTATDSRFKFGSPFMFYNSGCYQECSIDTSVDCCPTNFLLGNFILDLIIWYLIICLIIFTYNKIRSKR